MVRMWEVPLRLVCERFHCGLDVRGSIVVRMWEVPLRLVCERFHCG